MIFFKRDFILFSFFIILVSIIFLPGISRADDMICDIYADPEPGIAGCATKEEVWYCTQCNESFQVGGCEKIQCYDEYGEKVGECWTCWTGPIEEWSEYKCEEPTCDGIILTRECESYVCKACGECKGTCSECNDEKVCVRCEEWELCEDCQDWQVPRRDPPCHDPPPEGVEDLYEIMGLNDCELISTEDKKPDCVCEFHCLETPENPKYYNNPIYPLDKCNINSEDEAKYQMDEDNVYLPVKLYWDDVKGWRDGWIENGECYKVLECAGSEKACYQAPSDSKFDSNSAKLESCITNCRNKCYETASKMNFGQYWLAPYKILTFYRENCLNNCTINCRKSFTTNAAGCTDICPQLDSNGGGSDYCYIQPKSHPPYDVPEGYIQSYVIKITDEIYENEKELKTTETFCKREKLGDEIDYWLLPAKEDEYQRGDIRDPEAQQRINQLKFLAEEEKKKDPTDIDLFREYLKEIREIRKEKLYINKWIEALRQSEFLPPSPCFLKSGKTYTWQVRACCPFIEEVMSNEEFEEIVKSRGLCPTAAWNLAEKMKEDGVWVEFMLEADCGPWSDWEMTTSPAPEPKLPYDPDWTGEGFFKDAPPFTMWAEWCHFSDCDDNLTFEECRDARVEKGASCYWNPDYGSCRAYSHQFLSYIIENDDKEYHPHLDECNEERTECENQKLKPYTVGTPLYRHYHPPKFANEHFFWFTKDHLYSWLAASCWDQTARNEYCTTLGQEWRFAVADFDLKITGAVRPTDIDPGNADAIPVGLPVTLQWEATPLAMSFHYEIYEGTAGPRIKEGTTNIPVVSNLDDSLLNLNTIYRWRAKPCWSYDAELSKCGKWSDVTLGDFFYFKTTGQPPRLIQPENGSDEVIIPTTFIWQDVGGARSYRIKINGEEKIVPVGTTIDVGYPELLQDTAYSWQVQTCAKTNGVLCGNWSNEYSFETFRLKAPVNPKPADGVLVSTADAQNLSWDRVTGAKYYSFEITYLDPGEEEIRQECLDKVGETISKISNTNSVPHKITCGGHYQWEVAGCLISSCEPDAAGDSSVWSLRVFSPETTHKVMENLFIYEISPQIFEKVPDWSAEEIVGPVYDEVMNILAGMPKDVENGVIDRLEADVAQAEDISEELDDIFKKVWQDVVDALIIDPDIVPEGLLKQILAEKREETLKIISQRVLADVDAAMDMTEALDIVRNIIKEELKSLPKDVAERVRDEMYKEIREITKDIPGAILSAILNNISDLPVLEEAPQFFEAIIRDVWAVEAAKARAKAEANPNVSAAELEAALQNILEDVIDRVNTMLANKFSEIKGKIKVLEGGLLPCGRDYDVEKTLWNETEACGIKHIFIMIQVIVDFIFLQIVPFVLVLLALASGVIFYLSVKMEAPNPLAKVKALWRSAGIGLALILCAWLITSLILAFFGYKVGPWYIF